MKFHITHTDDVLVSHSGLALAGALLARTDLCSRLDTLREVGRRKPEVSDGDAMLSMIGLLCLGKSGFAAIETYRHEEFFARAIGVKKLLSEESLRQRLDLLGDSPIDILHEESALMLARHVPEILACDCGYIPMDIDVSPLDNSGTKKEGVAWTYKRLDGYAPIFAYLGEEGYLIDCELRPGDQHCQSGTPEFLDRAIKLARKATGKRLLVRMDSGNDAVENLQILRKNKADYIIKRNLRRESIDDWLETAEAFGECEEPRPGKEVFVGQSHLDRDGQTYRVVFKIVRRTIDADGQRLLLPEIEVDTWWTSLKLSASNVIQLYHEHGTSEQFHSELKSELGLERLPSGKFATNALVLSLGLVAYNILRMIGQSALDENDRLPNDKKAPLGKPVKRRRLRSVIRDLMYFAARLTRHAGMFRLALWRGNPWQPAWERVYHRFAVPVYSKSVQKQSNFTP